MPGSHSPYPPEVRRQMVELVRWGRTPEELAWEFLPWTGAVRSWVRQAELNQGHRCDLLTADERKELRRLRGENKQLRLEREILKKAAAWFARESDSIPRRDSGS